MQKKKRGSFVILTRLCIVAQYAIDAVRSPHIDNTIDNACTMRKTSGQWRRITHVDSKLKH